MKRHAGFASVDRAGDANDGVGAADDGRGVVAADPAARAAVDDLDLPHGEPSASSMRRARRNPPRNNCRSTLGVFLLM